jgi:aspartate dehydrogenase
LLTPINMTFSAFWEKIIKRDKHMADTFARQTPPTVRSDAAQAGIRTRLAIAGMGTVGATVARAVATGVLPETEITAVAARDVDKCRRTLDQIGCDAPITSLHDLHRNADVVLECAPAAIFEQIVRPAVAAGKKVIVLSAGALLSHFDLVEVARKNGGQIIVPTGALLGLDAVGAAAQGKIYSVTMTTRKPVEGLLGAPYLVKNNIDIAGLTEPLCVFRGTAREAAIGFPANLNVAVALSLAGIGPDLTTLEIWADPRAVRNMHRIVVESDSARLDMSIENIPSENPRTGRITALSVISLLKKMNAALRIG